MHGVTIKAASVALVLSMALSCASCGKKKTDEVKSRSGVVISADDPWYNTRKINVSLNIDESRPIDRVQQRLLGIDEDKMILLTNGYYKFPEKEFVDWSEMNSNDYDIETVTVIDRAYEHDFLVMDLTRGLASNTSIYGVEYSDGKIKANYGAYNDEEEEYFYYTNEYDPITGEQIGTTLKDGYDDYAFADCKIGNFRIRTLNRWNEDYATGYYCLEILSPDGTESSIDIKDAGNEDITIPAILAKDGRTAIIPVEKDYKWTNYELDLVTLTLSADNSDEYSWLNEQPISNPVTGTDGKTYFKTGDGISTINFKNKTIEEFFNFSWCDVGYISFSSLEIADINENSFVLMGEDWSHNDFTDPYKSNFSIIEFTKAQSNPHAGKKVLELYGVDYAMNCAVSDAIVSFNETSTDYHIEITDRYDSDYLNLDIRSADDYSAYLEEVKAATSSKLATDLMNGEGPDILINASQYGQLNDPEYLTDLTPYMSVLPPDEYFTNIINAAEVDGKLYNLPVSFYIEGIITDGVNAGDSGIGFTIPEYEDFLNNKLNGKDVINNGQNYYFLKLFNNMSDKFISDGKADFSVPEFAELANFVKDNVIVDSQQWEDLYTDDEDPFVTRNRDAELCVCEGYYSHMIEVAMMTGSSAIVGIPSSDGRGPCAGARVSVAVSAKACDIEACARFAKSLLSDEVQSALASGDSLVVNRSVFRQWGERAVEYINGDGYWAWFGWEGEDPNPQRLIFSEYDIDNLELCILSSKHMSYSDSDINAILIEEMPAYFSGQKDLDSVIKIAQDRVQKVLDERKN
ncbi:MAG: hypothetical protein IKS75_02755 [Clostridiales bacterium]|nr:hypothetical protein [Clostridiales bacterium]